jgi:GNAT superfamily N-acetyltransferase
MRAGLRAGGVASLPDSDDAFQSRPIGRRSPARKQGDHAMAITRPDAANPIALPTPRPLPASRLEAAAVVLARAFADDPATPYFVPEPARVIPVYTAFFAACLANGLAHGRVVALGDAPRAVAIWHTIDNDRAEMPEPDMASTFAMLDEPTQEQWASIFGHMGEEHRRLMPEPHDYLSILGVDPEQHGHGLGGALLAALLAGRTPGRPCYLETFNPRNLPFYERRGFRVAGESVVPGTTLRLWAMRHG